MIRKYFALAVILLLLLIPQLALAGTPASNLSSVRPKPAAVVKPPEVTSIRWAVHTDALTGASSLRLVMDVTGSVAAEAAVSASPSPSLIVTVKGAVQGSTMNSNVPLDGKIADSASIVTDGTDTKVAVALPAMVNDGGYRVFTLPGDRQANRPYRVVVDINKPLPLRTFNFTPGLKNKVIAIDPGHGGSDPGAVGPGKSQEKDITLAVALNVKALLEKAGATVVMTRLDDRDVYGPGSSAVQELGARTSIANSKNADIFISIHINSFTSPGVSGTTSYYYQKSAYDALLAQCLQSALVQLGGLKDRGVYPANFYVMKHTTMPASLVELGFISNPGEEKLLGTPELQMHMAQGIVQGLDSFFTQASSK